MAKKQIKQNADDLNLIERDVAEMGQFLMFLESEREMVDVISVPCMTMSTAASVGDVRARTNTLVFSGPNVL